MVAKSTAPSGSPTASAKVDELIETEAGRQVRQPRMQIKALAGSLAGNSPAPTAELLATEPTEELGTKQYLDALEKRP